MKLIDAYKKIQELACPIFQTSDVATYLEITSAHASKLLTQLASVGELLKIRRGLWAFPDKLEPLQLPEYLTLPFPSYVSLQTALFYHGMISQIPAVIYAVSIARTQKYKTPLGDYSIHHIDPGFFFGFTTTEKNNIKIASPEKALLDTIYLSTAKTRLFSKLPELEIPETFNIKTAKEMINQIESKNRKTLVISRFDDLLSL